MEKSKLPVNAQLFCRCLAGWLQTAVTSPRWDSVFFSSPVNHPFIKSSAWNTKIDCLSFLAVSPIPTQSLWPRHSLRKFSQFESVDFY
jgi:hypothetical protein